MTARRHTLGQSAALASDKIEIYKSGVCASACAFVWIICQFISQVAGKFKQRHELDVGVADLAVERGLKTPLDFDAGKNMPISLRLAIR